MNNEILQEKEHTKYLGVILDNTWKNHITQTNLRISKDIGILYKLRQCVSQSTLRSLYFAFVQSNVNYCLLNWGNAAPSNITPIKTNLNKALRIMCYKGPIYHALEDKIIKFPDIIKLNQLMFVQQFNNKTLPHQLEHLMEHCKHSQSFHTLHPILVFSSLKFHQRSLVVTLSNIYMAPYQIHIWLLMFGIISPECTLIYAITIVVRV